MNRMGYIGSSDIAPILGISPWKTPYVLYLEKIGEYKENITREKELFFIRRKLSEQYILSVARETVGFVANNTNRRFQDEEFPFLSCEIDSEFLCEHTGKNQNCELKSIGSNVNIKDKWGEEGTNEIPNEYLTQVMFALGVKNIEYGYRDYSKLFAMQGFDLFMQYHVDRDDELIQILRERAVEFWQRILDRNPPPPTTVGDFKLITPKSGSSILATTEIIELAEKIKVYKKYSKDLESFEEDFKLFIGENESVFTQSGTLVATWKSQRNAHGGISRILRLSK